MELIAQIIVWGGLMGLAFGVLFVLTLPLHMVVYKAAGDVLEKAQPIMDENKRLLEKLNQSQLD